MYTIVLAWMSLLCCHAFALIVPSCLVRLGWEMMHSRVSNRQEIGQEILNKSYLILCLVNHCEVLVVHSRGYTR
jgi:hypothetical protein